MVKKIFLLLCLSLIAIMPYNTVYAEDINNKAKVLEDLDIIEESRVTAGSFVKALGNFLYDDLDLVTDAEIVHQTGMEDIGTKFNSNATITVEKAVKYAVVALGYRHQAEQNGNYSTLAMQLGITAGLSSVDNSRLKYEDMVRILYNMLDIEPLQRVYDADEVYRTESGTTLLGLNREIYKFEGKVTSNAYTSIDRIKGTGNELYVAIDGIEYLKGKTNAEEFLGYNIEFYAKKHNDDEYEILYIGEKNSKNKVLEINSQDIELIASDFSQIKYLTASKTKTATISAGVSVIYNGVNYPYYTIEDLMPDIGGIKLLDNNKDNIYDIIFVDSYETMVVESVNYTNAIINNRYRFEDCLKSITLDSDNAFCKVYNADGKLTTLDSVKTNNIISVARSKGERDIVVKIYISASESFNGKITGMRDETDNVLINGVEYRKSDDFVKFINDTSKKLEGGKEYIFYTDYFGNLSYVKSILDNNYAVLYKIFEDDDSEICYATYMDMNNEWYTLPLAKKVNLDGVNKEALAVRKAFMGSDPQVVKLNKNLSNEINFIDTPETAASYTEGVFTKVVPQNKLMYRGGPKVFDMKYHLRNDAKIIFIPEDETDLESYYIKDANGYFTTNTSYPVTFYDCDRLNFVPLISMVENADVSSIAASKSMVVITGTGETVVGGDVLPFIEVTAGKFLNMSFVGAYEGIFNGYKKGDVIRFGTNYAGRVNYIKKIYDLNQFETKDVNDYYSDCYISGTVSDIDLEIGGIAVDVGRTSVFRVAGTKTIQVYNTSSNECESKTVSSLSIGDRVLFYISYGNLSEIICIKE